MYRGAQAQRLSLDISAIVGRADDEAMGGVGIAERVVGAFPVGVIVARPEMSNPQRRSESDGARHICGSSAVAQSGRQCREQCLRLLA